jgi:hypothetical protein
MNPLLPVHEQYVRRYVILRISNDTSTHCLLLCFRQRHFGEDMFKFNIPTYNRACFSDLTFSYTLACIVTPTPSFDKSFIAFYGTIRDCN